MISDITLFQYEVNKENANEGKHSVKDGKGNAVYEYHVALNYRAVKKSLPSSPSS
jgi:hypothetical protein